VYDKLYPLNDKLSSSVWSGQDFHSRTFFTFYSSHPVSGIRFLHFISEGLSEVYVPVTALRVTVRILLYSYNTDLYCGLFRFIMAAAVCTVWN